MLFEKKLETVLGNMHLVCSEVGMTAILFENHQTGKVKLAPHRIAGDSHPILIQAGRELQEYLEGRRTAFSVPVDCGQGTDFQKRVWQSLMRIPYGETVSYSEQAGWLEMKNGFRAVALANSRNPLSIIVPCHRVIAKSGNLQGYAGGLEVKRRLLALESGKPA